MSDEQKDLQHFNAGAEGSEPIDQVMLAIDHSANWLKLMLHNDYYNTHGEKMARDASKSLTVPCKDFDVVTTVKIVPRFPL